MADLPMAWKADVTFTADETVSDRGHLICPQVQGEETLIKAGLHLLQNSCFSVSGSTLDLPYDFWQATPHQCWSVQLSKNPVIF